MDGITSTATTYVATALNAILRATIHFHIASSAVTL